MNKEELLAELSKYFKASDALKLRLQDPTLELKAEFQQALAWDDLHGEEQKGWKAVYMVVHKQGRIPEAWVYFALKAPLKVMNALVLFHPNETISRLRSWFKTCPVEDVKWFLRVDAFPLSLRNEVFLKYINNEELRSLIFARALTFAEIHPDEGYFTVDVLLPEVMKTGNLELMDDFFHQLRRIKEEEIDLYLPSELVMKDAFLKYLLLKKEEDGDSFFSDTDIELFTFVFGRNYTTFNFELACVYFQAERFDTEIEIDLIESMSLQELVALQRFLKQKGITNEQLDQEISEQTRPDVYRRRFNTERESIDAAEDGAEDTDIIEDIEEAQLCLKCGLRI
jgi:hypothetical protein